MKSLAVERAGREKQIQFGSNPDDQRRDEIWEPWKIRTQRSLIDSWPCSMLSVQSIIISKIIVGTFLFWSKQNKNIDWRKVLF